MSKIVLLTGFEPFGGESVNPSWEAASRLDGESLMGAVVAARRLPCVFGEALSVLRGEMAALRPALVVAVGQAGGRPELSLERVAINVDDARIADNAGHRPIDRPVVPGGQPLIFPLCRSRRRRRPCAPPAFQRPCRKARGPLSATMCSTA